MNDRPLTGEMIRAHIQQLEEISSRSSVAVWASFTPLFEATNTGLEKKVEASFSLYLKCVDAQLHGRKNQIPRITWRHWYSSERDTYDYLHFHILYLLDETGLSSEEMVAIHDNSLAEIERLDSKQKLKDTRIALENQKLRNLAAKAGHRYKAERHYKNKPVINKERCIAEHSTNNARLVGYGSNPKKLAKEPGAGVYEIYSTSPHHTLFKIR